jgi:uncharacterized protein YggT (Ycf19 family)
VNVPELLSFDDILKQMIRMLLGPGLASGLILLAMAAYSWWKAAKDTAKISRIVVEVTKTTGRRMRRLDRIGRLLAVSAAAVMAIAQAAWLFGNYVIGNLLSQAVGIDTKFPANYLPTWREFWDSLHGSPVTDVYLLISVVGLAYAFVRARQNKDVQVLSSLFGLPGYIYGFCGFVGGSLTLLLYIFGVDGDFVNVPWIIFMYCAAVVGVVYAASCHLVLGAPAIVTQFWTTRSTDDRV